MRHGKKFNHLGRKANHRKSMLANMSCSLIQHKRIKTTLAKAKALRKFIEPLITKSKNDTTHSRRVVFSYLRQKDAITELFGEISSRISDREGGYTRIIKLGNRLGDNAEMCLIELVDFNENYSNEKPKKKSKSRRSRSSSKNKIKEGLDKNKKLDNDLVEETKAEETKVEETKVEETKVEETKVEEAKAEETKVEETKVEEAKAEETKAEETKAEETKVEETKAEETKVEETKVEETKAINNKEENAKDKQKGE